MRTHFWDTMRDHFWPAVCAPHKESHRKCKARANFGAARRPHFENIFGHKRFHFGSSFRPPLRPPYRPPFGHHVVPGEAFASWQWLNHLVSKVAAGKKALIINMDETAVCLYQGTGKGTVMAGKKRKRDGPVQRVNRATRRTYLTHVAFICDNPFYQKLLPQIIIGNEHTLLVRDMPELQRHCPGRFTLIRQKSAWNNAQLMCTIVERLWAALAPFATKVQPILLMDAAKLHWASPVMNKCSRRGVWPLPVPAKLTWLLQPCDTHMFQLYNLHLRKAYQRRREEAMTAGALDVQNLLDCVYETTEYVVEDISGWKQAVQDDGFGARQTQLSVFRKRQLQLEATPVIGDDEPSVEQVKEVVPLRSKVPPRSQLFRCSAMQAPLRRTPVLPPPSGVPRGLRLPGPAPSSATTPRLSEGTGRASAGIAALSGREPRTRSEHRLLAALARGRSSGA